MKVAKMSVLILLLAVLGINSAEIAEEVVFEETFDGKLKDGWRWIREESEDWRIKDGALEICVRPGDSQSVRNALVRSAPDRTQGKYAVEVTITNLHPPKNQFEQAGITWYCGGKPMFKLVKELVDGKLMIIPGRKPITNDTVQFRLVVERENYIAQFRPNGEGEFITSATGKLPAPDNDDVSIQCYHGSFEEDRWIRFDNFRIVKLSE
ncbi:MAG: hypothetical protein N2487_04940 [Verrucomicrobiae bacterium]|nr:hypothetical protein [Verrucomicrobiae bacterium]